MNEHVEVANLRAMCIEVAEGDGERADRSDILVVGRDIEFSTSDLESYATANWDPVVYDAMVVAAAVEYCDRSLRRSSRFWARQFAIKVPVHEPNRWKAPGVLNSLCDALRFLTGDIWSFEFVTRMQSVSKPRQGYLEIPSQTRATLAFSDGMDSRAVAGIVKAEYGHALVRVRLGSKRSDKPKKGEPFAAIPYKLKKKVQNAEPSARNRGFRFALISGLASYICKAKEIIIPESGQGALGPVLIPVAHAYPDYRNHPAFLKRMERFIVALLGHEVRYSFPRLWHTKGQTLKAYLDLTDSQDEWAATRSCWKSARWSTVGGEFRQCGVCAACMLRRLSVYAAGQSEPKGTYLAENLSAARLADSVPASFDKVNKAFTQYAIAGVLHMDHLADLATNDGQPVLRRNATDLAEVLGRTASETEANITQMILQHSVEWRAFVASLGGRSFVQNWVRGDR
ncbi:MAG: 7-cyano-7-deazaguanine synthase [Pseudomonadota bacterium]